MTGPQERRDYLWNGAASLTTSLALVVMLTVVSRTAGLQAAGVYSLAIGVGQQFQTLGMYEVRAYQVTDVRHRFAFGTYLATRFITVALMVAGIAGYALWTAGATATAALLVLVACLRVLDAFEDVFYAELQRVGHLDIGGRAATYRTLMTLLAFCTALVLTRELAVSTVAALVVALVVMLLVFLPPARGLFPLRPHWQPGAIRGVLVECLPLFLASFMAMYLVNAPRYAIDTYLDASSQGRFAIIYMPAVAINLLSLLVFRPLLTRMALRWVEGDTRGFTALVRTGMLAALAAFVLVAVVAYPLGPAILERVVGQDVSGLRTELMVLVAGGALNAAAVILYYALTTMRRQRLVLLGYVLASLAALVLCRVLVPAAGLMGAAWAYTCSMGVLAGAFGAFLSLGAVRARLRDGA